MSRLLRLARRSPPAVVTFYHGRNDAIEWECVLSSGTGPLEQPRNRQTSDAGIIAPRGFPELHQGWQGLRESVLSPVLPALLVSRVLRVLQEPAGLQEW